jgi:predicted HicB family RNase H-like nuclease
MIENKKRTQITFDINPEIKQKVKILAALRNISINLWVSRAINDRITKETKYDESGDNGKQKT